MVHLIQIGDSFGVRIPKTIVQQAGFKENIALVFTITKEGLLISPEKQVRKGWEQKCKSSKKEPPALLGNFSNEFEKDEW